MIRHGIDLLRENLDLEDPYLLKVVCDDDSHWPGQLADAFILGKDSEEWELVDPDMLADLVGEAGNLGRPLKRARTSRFLKGDRYVAPGELWPADRGITRQFYKLRCPKCRRAQSPPASKLHPILDTLALAGWHRITLVQLAARLRNASARNSR